MNLMNEVNELNAKILTKRKEKKLMKESMLTTIDNPYNPFEDFDNWYAYDTRQGYHTTSFLARIVVTSDELSYADQHLAFENAIDEIVTENVLGLYTKVTRVVPDEPVMESSG